jgi:long-subunit fatty acid transport protein
MLRLAFITVILLVSATALAGGYEYPDQGAAAVGRAGAFGAKANDLSALLYNPAGLANLKGFQFFYSHNLVNLEQSFRRAPITEKVQTDEFDPATMQYKVLDKNVTFPTVSNTENWFLKGAMILASYDFGLKDVTVAAGVFGPSAYGKSSFPINRATSISTAQQDADPSDPAKYMFVGKDVLVMYYTLAAAWNLERLVKFPLAVGVDLQWIDVPYLRFDMVTDGGQEGTIYPVNSPWDVLAHMDTSDRFNFGAVVGLWARPWRFLEVGLSSRVLPLNVHASGTMTVDLVGESLSGVTDWALCDEEKAECGKHSTKTTINYTQPPWIRAAVRFLSGEPGHEDWDVEVDATYEFWSMFDEIKVDLDSYMNIPELGKYVHLGDLHLAKNYQDTWSVRLGGDFAVLADRLWLRAGGLYESASMPQAYSNVDFEGYARWGLSTGFTVRLARWAELNAAYMHLFQENRHVGLDDTRVYQQRPGAYCTAPYNDPQLCDPNYLGKPGAPVGAGDYSSSINIVSVGVNIRL